MMSETKHTPGPWIIVKHGTDADIETRQDSGMVCCVATVWTRGERQEANAHLVAAAPEMLKALEELECYDCQHLMKYHVHKYGCEVERGDREGYEGEPAHAMGPCGCQCLDTPDMLNLITAIRKARGVA